ncbi:MAG: hypothetical protein CM1200mP18_09480 [Gammaproteobacteria bacterium]|nr:MAG: hypothetical protein CM1200mP18_09480 [Gammaproteobacteria bacterium]
MNETQPFRSHYLARFKTMMVPQYSRCLIYPHWEKDSKVEFEYVAGVDGRMTGPVVRRF